MFVCGLVCLCVVCRGIGPRLKEELQDEHLEVRELQSGEAQSWLSAQLPRRNEEQKPYKHV